MARARAEAKWSVSERTDLLGLHFGHQELRQWEIAGQALDLGDGERVPLEAELACRFHCAEEIGVDIQAGRHLLGGSLAVRRARGRRR